MATTTSNIRIKPGQSRLGYLIHDVARLRRTVVDKALKPLGATRSQWWVLANLSRYSEEGMMQTQLAMAMDIGKVALGGILDRLEANGHVERRLDPIDRRVKRLSLTDEGERMLTAIEHRASALNRVMTRGISVQDILTTENTLQSLKKQLIEMDTALKTGVVDPDEPRTLY
jgi:DNA-binding MarR family transcriptional regulator